jgi:hypothetical protein
MAFPQMPVMPGGGNMPAPTNYDDVDDMNGQAAYGTPSFATSPVNTTAPVYPAPSQVGATTGSYAQAGNGNGNGNGAAGNGANNGASRTCPNCSKLAGKGKFCIECGQFIGLPQAELSTTAEVVPGGYQYGVGGNMGNASAGAGSIPTAGNGIIPSYAEANGGNQNVAVDSMGNAVDGPSAGEGSLSALPGQQATPRYGGLRPQTRDAMPSKRGLFESASEIANTAQQVLNPTEPTLNQTRRPMTSLNPDVSHLGLDNGKKPGVEF